MSKAERISERLPRFLRHWDSKSLIHGVIGAASAEMGAADAEIGSLMRAHWIDTASGHDLDKLGALTGLPRMQGEIDVKYRSRLKRAASEYRGGGTIASIEGGVRALIGAAGPDDVALVENPPLKTHAEFRVISGDTWVVSSRSIKDATPTITLQVEEGGEVSDPVIANLETGETITYDGALTSGQKLVLTEKDATVDGQSVMPKVSFERFPQLVRKGSTWRYTESLSKMIGVFDKAKFDEHTFMAGIPYVRIGFEWTSLQPATFEVQIRSKALERSGIPANHVEKYVSTMKAAGVKAIISIVE